MSSVRGSVEWVYHLVSSLWAYVDCHQRLKLGQQPVGLIYQAAAIMTNVHACMYNGNQVYHYFHGKFPNYALRPPTLKDYLQGGAVP